jgi:UDP-N-acetyl-2-amino-2-deoxyglucuronate dehydrogenase
VTRAVVLGAGVSGLAHLAALDAAGIEVACVSTRDAGRLSAARELIPDVPVAWPPSAALNAPGVELVVVATPPGTHLELVTLAAARRLDVLVEKPLELDLPRSRRLVEAAEDAGIGLGVCFQHRTKPAAVALRDLVRRGGLGKVTGGTVTVPWWRGQEYYDRPGRGRVDHDGGGVLITQAVHFLDLYTWCVGMPGVALGAAGLGPGHRIQSEDVFSGTLRYANGALVSLAATTAAYPGGVECLTVWGTRGTAVLRGGDLVVHDGTDPGGRMVVSDAAPGAGSDPAGLPVRWHRRLIQSTVDAFRNGRRPPCDGRSALATQSLVAALYRSAAKGVWVAVDDPVLYKEG